MIPADACHGIFQIVSVVNVFIQKHSIFTFWVRGKENSFYKHAATFLVMNIILKFILTVQSGFFLYFNYSTADSIISLIAGAVSVGRHQFMRKYFLISNKTQLTAKTGFFLLFFCCWSWEKNINWRNFLWNLKIFV